jgi:hypothetical protein
MSSTLTTHAAPSRSAGPALLAEAKEVTAQLAAVIGAIDSASDRCSLTRAAGHRLKLYRTRPPTEVLTRQCDVCTVCATWENSCHECGQAAQEALGLRQLAGQLWKAGRS